jgi:hypothetical protein
VFSDPLFDLKYRRRVVIISQPVCNDWPGFIRLCPDHSSDSDENANSSLAFLYLPWLTSQMEGSAQHPAQTDFGSYKLIEIVREGKTELFVLKTRVRSTIKSYEMAARCVADHC